MFCLLCFYNSCLLMFLLSFHSLCFNVSFVANYNCLGLLFRTLGNGKCKLKKCNIMLTEYASAGIQNLLLYSITYRHCFLLQFYSVLVNKLYCLFWTRVRLFGMNAERFKRGASSSGNYRIVL